jgi:hypothetical protein
MDDAMFRPRTMMIRRSDETAFPCAPARVYVLGGKPAGLCRRIPVVQAPDAAGDRISYGALIRAESGYKPTEADRREIAARGGRAKKRAK